MPHKLVTFKSIKNRSLYESHSVQFLKEEEINNLEEALGVFNEITRLIQSLGPKYSLDPKTGEVFLKNKWSEDFYKYFVNKQDFDDIYWFMTETIGQFKKGQEVLDKKELVDKVLKINKNDKIK